MQEGIILIGSDISRFSRGTHGDENYVAIVKPETVIAWHRKGFRLFWTWKVRHGQPGRPSVLKDVRDLIRLMSRANPTMLVRENLSKAISVQPAALSLRWYTQPRLRKGSK